MENINYYQKEFKKIQSLDKPKLKLDCEHDESEWLDINRDSIDTIISEFKKIREQLFKPTPNEWKEIMEKIKNNHDLFFKIPDIFGEYFFDYFLSTVPPLRNASNYVICGEPYSENKYIVIIRNHNDEFFIAIADLDYILNSALTNKYLTINSEQAKVLFMNNQKIYNNVDGHLTMIESIESIENNKLNEFYYFLY